MNTLDVEISFKVVTW